MNPEMIEGSERHPIPTLQSAVDEVSEQTERGQDGTIIGLNGPRVVEQSSSDESSPQTSRDSQAVNFENIPGSTPAKNRGSAVHFKFTPQSLPAGYESTTTGADAAGEENISSPGISIPQSTPWLPSNDQMELDQNFFEFFGDMDALSQGGLTGLEDWSQMPMDLMDLPDINWQAIAANDTAATL